MSDLKCQNGEKDLYTSFTSNLGNKSLKYSIGLINCSEVFAAGGQFDTINTMFYLYNNSSILTMTPYIFNPSNSSVSVLTLHANGKIYPFGVASYYEVRPVINLKSTVKISDGNGTMANPFVVKTD